MNRFGVTLKDLYHERTNFSFIDRSWRWLVLSGLLIAIALGALALRGLEFGIDFTGGVAWEVELVGERPGTDEVRDTVSELGVGEAKISFREDRGTGETTLVVQSAELPDAGREEVSTALEAYGSIRSVTEVGPTWGASITEQAWRALIVFFVVIGIYLALRFEWRMSIAALIAVVHDIIITVGVYALTGATVAPATIVAFLTILGFSLYDTVVVFDKVKENEALLGSDPTDTYSDMVNRSLNQVLARSLNTSLTSTLPIISIMVVGVWYLGATGLQDFALALLVGVLAGTYSSIFVATPMVAWINERRPKNRALRERAEITASRRARGGVSVGVEDAGALAAAERVAIADRLEVEDSATPPPVSPSTPAPSPPPSGESGGVTPRPRKRRRKRR